MLKDDGLIRWAWVKFDFLKLDEVGLELILGQSKIQSNKRYFEVYSQEIGKTLINIYITLKQRALPWYRVLD